MAGGSLRNPETQKQYEDLLRNGTFKDSCPLCTKVPIVSFTHWKIISNDYPYDKIADSHDMIVSVRHVTQSELTLEEWLEYNTIKQSYIAEHYDYLMESTAKRFSLPNHFHVQLLTIRNDR